MGLRALTVAGLCLMAALLQADEMILKDGTRIKGKLVAADEKIVVFRTDEGLVTKKLEEIKSITFGEPEAAGGLPPGISVAGTFKAARWTTFRRITKFSHEEMGSITSCKISADGSKIVFSTYVGGVFTINPDGSKLVQLSKKGQDGLTDISADGKKVAWYEGGREGFIADSDGSNRVKLPGGFHVLSIRLTARGDRLFVLSGEQGAIYALPADGSDVKRLITIAQVAKLGATDENNNHWRGNPSGIDISDDGSKIVFHVLWDAYASNTDGSNLRKLTQFSQPENRSLYRVRISGNGAKIGWHNESGNDSSLTIEDWGGGNRVVHKGRHCASGWTLQFTRDGSAACMSGLVGLFSAADAASWNVTDMGLAGDEAKPLDRAYALSMNASGTRLCMAIDHNPDSIVLIETNPASIEGCPTLQNLSASPNFVLMDGSTVSAVTAQSDADDYVGVSVFRNGWRLEGGGWPNARIVKGSLDKFSYRFDGAPGPVTLRFFAFHKSGNAIAVDVDGFEVRKP